MIFLCFFLAVELIRQQEKSIEKSFILQQKEPRTYGQHASNAGSAQAVCL
jgi:hypothetical protein